ADLQHRPSRGAGQGIHAGAHPKSLPLTYPAIRTAPPLLRSMRWETLLVKSIDRLYCIRVLSVALIMCPLLPRPALASHPLPSIVANDNTRAAGVVSDGTLTLNLRAAAGLWRPEGEDGPALRVEAFGEISSSLSVPAPLI